MAAAVSIEHAGGPKIDMKYGRKVRVCVAAVTQVICLRFLLVDPNPAVKGMS